MKSWFISFLGTLVVLTEGLQCIAKETHPDNIEDLPVLEELEFVDSNGELVMLRRHVEHARIKRAPSKVICGCTCRRTKYGERYHCCRCPFKGGCFPAIATARSSSGDVIKMADLRRGQKILTSYGGNMVETKVLAFLKRQPEHIVVYLKLETSTGHTLSLSPDHVIFTSKYNDTKTMVTMYSESVVVGDFVFVNMVDSALEPKLVPSQVISVVRQAMEGVYVPLTEHGTLMVDDVYTSCYATFSHRIAHMFMLPIRWFPSVFAPPPMPTGMRAYVHYAKAFGRLFVPFEYKPKHRKLAVSKTTMNTLNNCVLDRSSLWDMKANAQKPEMTCPGKY